MLEKTNSTRTYPSLPETIDSVSLDLGNITDLFRWHRVCLRVYGMLTWDLDQQVETMVNSMEGTKRSTRKALTDLLHAELPVILGLYALERLQKVVPNLPKVAQEMLLPCFSLSYSDLFGDKLEDPLKHFLARLDWFLDAGNDPAETLNTVLTTSLENKVKDINPILNCMKEDIFPEIDRRVILAWRCEF